MNIKCIAAGALCLSCLASTNVFASNNIEDRINKMYPKPKIYAKIDYSQYSGRIDDLIDKYYNSYIQKHTVENMIFVGDSRVVGMLLTSGRYHYIGEESTGYDWMVGVAEGALASSVAKYPEADIIMCFGVNDVGNIGAYINEYQRLYSIYGDKIWFMSVNPIDDSAAAACGYFANNSMVINFNNALKEAMGDRYLDCYSKMIENGFGTQDGVHYTADTYINIENYTKELIENA